MPRPGPRPFECIRRAWHSDSHQPLRGTLIHEIFRLVNELHSTSTRRKKEWQEKLPIVVLRAEEILYSKANSELQGEYADVETLRSRLDDAVNTMIRREDSEEEGVYLVPCVEAALSLGCTPKKGTRGQRQGSSRHLLNAARRASPTARRAANEDCSAVTMSMDSSVHMSHDKHSNSTFNLMSTQVLPPVQEQDFRLVTHPSNSSLLSPVSTFWGPASCYPSNANIIPPQNPTFNRSPDASLPAGASSFPKPGALVQFFRTTDACRFSGLSCPEALYGLPQARFNVNQGFRPLQLLDLAESSGSRMGSRLPYADGNMCAPCHPPPCTISRLLQDVSRDSCIAADHQYKPSLGAVIATALDSTSCIVVQNALPSSCGGLNTQLKEFLSLPGSGHGSSTSLLPNLCNTYKAAISQRNFLGALSGVDDNSASLSDVHDLQLRIGPPVNEPTATSDDASAPKRMRVDTSCIQLQTSYHNST